MGLLELNGLSPELLMELSYASQLGRSLKNNLDSFEKEALLQDALAAAEWLDINPLLAEVAIDYRIKSEESIRSKYERCYPHRPVIKTFNDILGFRSCCDDYREALSLALPQFKIVDLSHGKAVDDGYRGVHLYYQPDNFHYPIELQFNTLYDRQLNNWLHDYLYKKNYPASVGQALRTRYEQGDFCTIQTFEEVLNDVLSRCER